MEQVKISTCLIVDKPAGVLTVQLVGESSPVQPCFRGGCSGAAPQNLWTDYLRFVAGLTVCVATLGLAGGKKEDESSGGEEEELHEQRSRRTREGSEESFPAGDG